MLLIFLVNMTEIAPADFVSLQLLDCKVTAFNAYIQVLGEAKTFEKVRFVGKMIPAGEFFCIESGEREGGDEVLERRVRCYLPPPPTLTLRSIPTPPPRTHPHTTHTPHPPSNTYHPPSHPHTYNNSTALIISAVLLVNFYLSHPLPVNLNRPKEKQGSS